MGDALQLATVPSVLKCSGPELRSKMLSRSHPYSIQPPPVTASSGRPFLHGAGALSPSREFCAQVLEDVEVILDSGIVKRSSKWWARDLESSSSFFLLVFESSVLTEAVYTSTQSVTQPQSHDAPGHNESQQEWSCVSYTCQGDCSLVLAMPLQLRVFHLTIYSIEIRPVRHVPQPCQSQGSRESKPSQAQPHWESPDSSW